MQNHSTISFDAEKLVSFPCPHCRAPIALLDERAQASPFDPGISALLDNLVVAQDALIAARRQLEGELCLR
jgi:hypothetical protein